MNYIKNLFGILVFCFITMNLGAQTPTPPNGKKWQKVEILSDEFNGNSLDATKWDDYHPHWKGRPPSEFKKGNAFVQGGLLKLRSTLKRHPSTVNNPFKDIWVNSAACVSKGKTAKPGYYYEARFKASSLSMTSSFWFRVGRFSEIDVIEHIGNPSRPNRQDDLPYEYAANTHYYGPHQGLQNKKTTWRMPTRGRDGFHTYGFWWKSPKELLFYYDGRQVMKIAPRVPLNENLKMIFDTEVFPFAQAGVANIGLPKVENLNNNAKNTMQVDWVRVYKLTNGTPPPPAIDKVSFKNAPTTVNPASSYTFTMEYSASQDREIAVSFWKKNSWVVSKVERVSKGSGTEAITVNLPSIATLGNGYAYKTHIRPVGTNWQQALDNDEITNVSVVEETPPVYDQLITNGTYYITSAVNNQRLVSRLQEQHSARMHNATTNDDQKWVFRHVNDDIYTIQNKGNSRYLEVSNAKCGNGSNVTTWIAANDTHQKWKISKNGNAYALKPMHCQTIALDRDAGALNANVHTWRYSPGNNNQKWKILLLAANSAFNKKESIIGVYPNPMKDFVTVSGLNPGGTIKIYDLLGTVMTSVVSKSNKQVISTVNYDSGIYIITVGKLKLQLIKE